MAFPGYSGIRKDRPSDYGVQAEGVATLIRSNAGIKYTKFDEDATPNDRGTDVLLVKIVWHGHTFLFTNIYNPPFPNSPIGRPAFTADYTLTACLNRVPV